MFGVRRRKEELHVPAKREKTQASSRERPRQLERHIRDSMPSSGRRGDNRSIFGLDDDED